MNAAIWAVGRRMFLIQKRVYLPQKKVYFFLFIGGYSTAAVLRWTVRHTPDCHVQLLADELMEILDKCK